MNIKALICTMLVILLVVFVVIYEIIFILVFGALLIAGLSIVIYSTYLAFCAIFDK